MTPELSNTSSWDPPFAIRAPMSLASAQAHHVGRRWRRWRTPPSARRPLRYAVDAMSKPSDDPAPQGAGERRRLDSWKEIAAYLGRGIRTVQRWEREEGLPVHRLAHAERGSVFADPTELTEWWKSRQIPPAGKPPIAAPRSLNRVCSASPARRRPHSGRRCRRTRAWSSTCRMPDRMARRRSCGCSRWAVRPCSSRRTCASAQSPRSPQTTRA